MRQVSLPPLGYRAWGRAFNSGGFAHCLGDQARKAFSDGCEQRVDPVPTAMGLNLAIGLLLPHWLAPGPTARPLLQAGLWGVSFTHYCLDARIWHVRQNKELALALGMA